MFSFSGHFLHRNFRLSTRFSSTFSLNAAPRAGFHDQATLSRCPVLQVKPTLSEVNETMNAVLRLQAKTARTLCRWQRWRVVPALLALLVGQVCPCHQRRGQAAGHSNPCADAGEGDTGRGRHPGDQIHAHRLRVNSLVAKRSRSSYSAAALKICPTAPVPRRPPVATGAGSGVIVDAADGLVVTNHHVINGANAISVPAQ